MARLLRYDSKVCSTPFNTVQVFVWYWTSIDFLYTVKARYFHHDLEQLAIFWIKDDTVRWLTDVSPRFN